MWCVIGIPYFIISYYILHSLYSAAHTLLQYLWLILSGVVRHTWVLHVHSHSWKSASKRFRGSWLKRNTIDCVVSVFSVISDTCPWLLQTLLVFCRALPREGAECKVSMFTGLPCLTQSPRRLLVLAYGLLLTSWRGKILAISLCKSTRSAGSL